MSYTLATLDAAYGIITYSMTRAIGATPCEKVSSVNAIVCAATIADLQWKSLVTWTDLSNGHINEHVVGSATSV